VDTRSIAVGDVELLAAEAGAGGRPFLLVHGFTGSREDFTLYLDPLADMGFHAVSPDLRGHGGSSKPEGTEHYSLEIWAQDLIGLIEALGWSSCTLLGHSAGGMAAQLLTLQRPGLVDALILMDTTHGAIPGLAVDLMPLAFQVIDEGGMAALGEVIRGIGGALGSSEAARSLAEQNPGHDDRAWGRFADLSPDMWKAMAPVMVEQPDRLADLAQIAAPTLVVVGDQDTPFVPDSERMAQTIPGAKLVVLPDSGHSPQFENPEPWWDTISGFVAEVAAPV
jgi:pimeloyl-ACP methyl ester carboxylesterase